MSRLDELIAKFCPNGVKYRELKDILIIKNGKDCLLYTSDAADE